MGRAEVGGMTDYAAIPGVRSTHLRLLARRTPAHYRWAEDHDEDGSDDTASRRWLRAVHCAVLQPEIYAAEYAVYPGRRVGAKYDIWLQARPGIQALTEGEEAAVRGIAAALRAHPDAARILWGPGWSEVTRTWTDQPSRLTCRARLDRVIPRVGQAQICEVWDLKTLGDASPIAVRWQVLRQRYDLQLAHYRAGILAGGRAQVAVCGLVVVEAGPPHDVGVYRFSEPALAAAELERQELLARIAECERSGQWPGACPEAIDLDLADDDVGELDTGDDDG